ncbi:MAG: cell division protein FtsA [Nitrospirae bacterium]|nr:cell division protein FtsA [Nitrospirota bacterium]
MNSESIVVGLDVGTTKICVVVGEVTDEGIDILAVGTFPSTGMRKGVVISIESTVESVREAVEEAESRAGVEIRAVYVGIAGGHIKGFKSYGATGIKGKEVTPLDIERVIDSAKAVYVPLDREVLHVIPTEFILDGQDGIRDPTGMIGGRLEVKVHIITGTVTSVQNLLKCCEKAGLEVIDIVFEPLASAEATLTHDEKELGVALIDMGGGTTDIVLYKDGWLRHTSVLAIGGNHLTSDVAVGLRIPVSEAERIKKSFGSAAAGMVSESEEIDISQIGGQLRRIPRRYLSEIIQPRCEELLELIKGELNACSGYDIAASGVVLTGGASLLNGLDRMTETILGLPVRTGVPENGGKRLISPLEGDINSPIYATGVGLVLYGSETESNRVFLPDLFTGIFGRMKGWVMGIFR